MLTRRTEFTIKFSADLDGFVGWGHEPQDWINLAQEAILRQRHYNTTAELLNVEIIPPRKEAIG